MLSEVTVVMESTSEHVQQYQFIHYTYTVYTLYLYTIYRLFHCAPNVPHYAKNKAVGVMKPGHCFTIEPMISEGVGAFAVFES